MLNKNVRAAIAAGRSAIVVLLEGVNRAGKRAARQAARVYTRSVHVHQAAEPSSPASPTPLRSMRTFQSGKCAHGSMLGRETVAVRRAQ